MAGAGFKDFAVGEVLTASDVDTYLMQQSVMRFADSGARGSALGTATGTAVPLAEGMVSYLDDANYVQVYNGSGWTSAIPGIGSNVAQTVKTDTFSTTSDSFVDVTGLSVSITPTSSTSKVLVIATFRGSRIQAANSGSTRTQIVRSGANSPTATSAGSRSLATGGLYNWIDPGGRGVSSDTILWLDTPGVSTAVTYTGQIARSRAGTAVLNRSDADADSSESTRTVSSIMAIEVAV